MRIPNKNDFQPSAETLKKWLSTRKPILDIGGGQFPGFLSDEGNTSDTNWFWIALIGESVGLVTTVYGGFRSGGIFLIFACLAILMFILLDYFFAVKLHRQKGLVCKLASEKMLKDPKMASDIADIEYKLRRGKFVDFLLITGIILIAVVKIIGIVLLGVFNNLILYVPFAIYYLIVAYVHIYHTGYYFAYRSTEKAIARNHRDFATGEYQATEHRQRVVTDSPLDLPARHNPHEIIEDASGNTNSYIIKAKGVLTDPDVINLIDNQTDNNKIPLLKACRKLQLETIEAA